MSFQRFLLPRIEYILLAAVFWGISASGPRILNFDGDLPRHLLTGNLILQTRHVPTTDIFSFRTAGYPSIPHEWLSQVLFAAIHNWLGLDGIVLMTALVIMLTWGVVYYQAFQKSNSFFAALIVTALGVAASQLHVLPRPHIFTYLLTALWITLLDEMVQSKSRSWWILPIVMFIWVNMHGMFVLGLLIFGVYVVGDFLEHPTMEWLNQEKVKRLLVGGALSGIVTFFSPSGANIWTAIVSLGGDAYITSRIPEYQSPNFHMPETWPFLMLFLLTTLGAFRSREKTPWTHTLLVILFTGMALYTSRMISLCAIVAAPLAARALASWLRSELSTSYFFVAEANISRTNFAANGAVWILAIIVVTALVLHSGTPIDAEGKGNIFDPHVFPVQATDWLESHPLQGHMFNAFDWGGYLLLRLWPEQQIFMDGHTHIYGTSLTQEYEQVITVSQSWEDIFQRYDITWVILPPHWTLTDELLARGWKTMYRDQTAIVLVRE